MGDLEKLAADIKGHGNQTLFGITGSGATLTLLDALEKQGLRSIRTHFEGSAALMAATEGRLAGRAGICFGIKGPGLANMISGLAVAWLEAFPVVAIVEAYPLGSNPEKAHKKLDQAALVSGVAKGARYLSEALGFREMAEWSESEVPGPVLLELAGCVRLSQTAIPAISVAKNDTQVLLQIVEQARRPVIIAGSLAVRKDWRGFLEQLAIPVFSTAAAKGIIDETLPMSAGVYTGVGLELTPESSLLSQSDLVIGLGLRPNELLSTRPFPCRSINFDPVLPAGAEGFQFAATSFDIPENLWPLLATKSWGLDLVEDSLTRLDKAMSGSFLPGLAYRIFEEIMGRDIRLVMDTGFFCTIGEHAWRAPRADLCLLSGQGRYMGTVVPMAIGAALHDPDTPVVAVSGDGGIGMYAGEIRLAVEHRLPILFVLMSDGRFGSIAPRALSENLTLQPLTVSDPSWLSIMEGFGLPTWHADSPEAIQIALQAWMPDRGPGYLELNFDPESYQNMCTGIR